MESNKIWELAVGSLHKSLNKEEEEEFGKIKDTDEVQKIIRQVNQVHFKTANSLLIHRVNKEKNWEYINHQTPTESKYRKLMIHSLKYAAVFALALLIGIMVPRFFGPDTDELPLNTIELEWGQMSKLTLSDGTEVWLNAGTKFEYPTSFDSRKRTVVLSGEAQFKVARNDKIPFEVKTKSGTIKVHGTTFNVESYDDDPNLVVTLIEGKVSVNDVHENPLVVLEPSEQFIFNKITGETNQRKINTEFYITWINGKILLNETKLSDLAKILERWYNVDIDLLGENIEDIKISGTIIKGKPLDLFLKILESMYGIEYELKANNDRKDELKIFKN
ncbi:FecR family protein [Gaoshiqia sediminis]|uniref:FecR family protein n=1 Tax=Gaoshiqia sediminis TaxID=2986998 RepID=A0AA41Y883_9BACT|nr:FecR family protein [Gaoshiqia sediminis]MCW0482728.1 FecR family protein [Gaoshiqia sediminis]